MLSVTISRMLLVSLVFLNAGKAGAMDYYVDPQGHDANKGAIGSPWKTVIRAIQAARPDDTIYLRDGIYRQSHTIGQWYFARGGGEKARIKLRSYPGEQAIITSMKLRNDPSYWTLIPGHKSIYVTDLKKQDPGLDRPKVERVSNCSQDGLPLKLMSSYNDNGNPSDLKGPGQWVRNVKNWKLYVWSTDGRNPGYRKTEFSHFVHGGTNTISITRNFRGGMQADYLTFEGLTIEGGHYPIKIETDHIQIKNCVIRNCYADAVKIGGAKPRYTNNPGDSSQDAKYYNSKHGLVENCDIYHFGEQGIDITGGDYWVVRNNRIHDNANNRGDMPRNTKASGIIMKNNSIGVLAENNRIYNLDAAFGAITIGGASFGGIAKEAVGAVVRNNAISNISGPYAVMFEAAINCSFYGNTISNCELTSAIIQMRRSIAENQATNNKNCLIMRNRFLNNKVTFGQYGQYHFAYREYHKGCMDGMVSDYNVIDPSLTYYFGSNKTLAEFRLEGFEVHSIPNSELRKQAK